MLVESEVEELAKTEENILNLRTSPDPWINNGLATLIQRLEEYYSDTIKIHMESDSVTIEATNDKSLKDSICKSIKRMAARDTYYFSAVFKILNYEFDSNYSPPKSYPETSEDLNARLEISEEEREYLKKKRNMPNIPKKEKIWKQRLSLFPTRPSPVKNYIERGLTLCKNEKDKVEAIFTKGGRICPICASNTKKLFPLPQQFNPIVGEHHNNQIEGIGDIRLNLKACPKCILMSYFSSFNGKIPFYQIQGGKVYLAIPNTVNLKTLKKINDNLSTHGQFENFHDNTCTSYSTNIKSLPHKCMHASLLALLHNIKNRYSVPEPEGLIMGFESPTKEEFTEMTEWLFISKSYKITHIKSNERIYDILDKFEDPHGWQDVYLVPDVFKKIYFNNVNEYTVESFFEGILKLSPTKISSSLFDMAKISTETPINQAFRPNGSSPFYLFEILFLPRILEVSTMLDEPLKNACRELAKSIGRGFSKDVGMLTKFAYASGPEDFKQALEEASFRLAKKSALEDESYYIGEESLSTIFGSLEPNDFQDIKNYFVSFMSISVLAANYKKKQKEGS